MAAEPGEFDIVRLGAQGDGVAEAADGKPQFVPFALPGERVRVTGDNLPEVLGRESSERRVPVCRHFGVCGGCVAQHMSDALYAEWKRGIVVEAFRQRGLEVEIAPLTRVPPASRRRAVLTAKRDGKGVVLGYHRRRSHELFDVEHCPVLRPEIVASLPALRAMAGTLGWTEVRFTVLATTGGLDIAVDGSDRKVGASAAAALAQLGAQYRLARVTIGGETLVERAAPVMRTAGAEVVPPPGAFVQAVAEAAMVAAVLAGAGKPKRAADLFCGIGTFALGLARICRVAAFDSDEAAIGALSAAMRGAQGLKPIETRVRDLFREPLSPRELAGLDLVVLDPPRAGAKAQCEGLAASQVPRIVYVSCDPATLARDVRILADAGYRPGRVEPIDQFVYSPHVEVVVTLSR